MNIIITSFTFIPEFISIFNESNIQHKFLLYDDILKKINKNYLKKSKIVFIYDDQYDKIKQFKKLIKKYNNKIQILFIDTSSFFLNDTSTFFINEFLHSNFHLNDLQKCFKKKIKLLFQIFLFIKLIKLSLLLEYAEMFLNTYLIHFINFYLPKNLYLVHLKFLMPTYHNKYLNYHQT